MSTMAMTEKDRRMAINLIKMYAQRILMKDDIKGQDLKEIRDLLMCAEIKINRKLVSDIEDVKELVKMSKEEDCYSDMTISSFKKYVRKKAEDEYNTEVKELFEQIKRHFSSGSTFYRKKEENDIKSLIESDLKKVLDKDDISKNTASLINYFKTSIKDVIRSDDMDTTIRELFDNTYYKKYPHDENLEEEIINTIKSFFRYKERSKNSIFTSIHRMVEKSNCTNKKTILACIMNQLFYEDEADDDGYKWKIETCLVSDLEDDPESKAKYLNNNRNELKSIVENHDEFMEYLDKCYSMTKFKELYIEEIVEEYSFIVQKYDENKKKNPYFTDKEFVHLYHAVSNMEMPKSDRIELLNKISNLVPAKKIDSLNLYQAEFNNRNKFDKKDNGLVYKNWDILQIAMHDGKYVKIKYRGLDKETETEVYPISIVYENNSFYLVAAPIYSGRVSQNYSINYKLSNLSEIEIKEKLKAMDRKNVDDVYYLGNRYSDKAFSVYESDKDRYFIIEKSRNISEMYKVLSKLNMDDILFTLTGINQESNRFLECRFDQSQMKRIDNDIMIKIDQIDDLYNILEPYRTKIYVGVLNGYIKLSRPVVKGYVRRDFSNHINQIISVFGNKYDSSFFIREIEAPDKNYAYEFLIDSIYKIENDQTVFINPNTLGFLFKQYSLGISYDDFTKSLIERQLTLDERLKEIESYDLDLPY